MSKVLHNTLELRDATFCPLTRQPLGFAVVLPLFEPAALGRSVLDFGIHDDRLAGGNESRKWRSNCEREKSVIRALKANLEKWIKRPQN